MKVLSYPRFPYPNFWQGHAWCDVDVYRLGLTVLVVLRDQADHEGPSLTNALEIVAREVRERLLAPQGLERMTPYWIEWSRTDGVAGTEDFEGPELPGEW